MTRREARPLQRSPSMTKTTRRATKAMTLLLGALVADCRSGRDEEAEEPARIIVHDPPSLDGCASTDALANDGCNWICNDPASPQLRVVSLDLVIWTRRSIG